MIFVKLDALDIMFVDHFQTFIQQLTGSNLFFLGFEVFKPVLIFHGLFCLLSGVVSSHSRGHSIEWDQTENDGLGEWVHVHVVVKLCWILSSCNCKFKDCNDISRPKKCVKIILTCNSL